MWPGKATCIMRPAPIRSTRSEATRPITLRCTKARPSTSTRLSVFGIAPGRRVDPPQGHLAERLRSSVHVYFTLHGRVEIAAVGVIARLLSRERPGAVGVDAA